MKKTLTALLFLIAATAAFAADVDLSGTWKVDSETVGNTSTVMITFKQDGTKLTMTMKGPDGKEVTSTGKVEGKKVTWSFKGEWEGNPLTVTYVGMIDDTGVINGTSDVQPMGVEGTFVAHRADATASGSDKKS